MAYTFNKSYIFFLLLNTPPNSHVLKFANTNNLNGLFDGLNTSDIKDGVRENNELNASSFYLEPEEGSLILFPSRMEHCTATKSNNFKGERLAIIGDITLVYKEDGDNDYSMDLLILSIGGHINEGYCKNWRVFTRYSTDSYENMWFTSHKIIDEYRTYAIELSDLNMLDHESFMDSLINKVKHLIQQQDENEPILDGNIPFEIDGELDIQNLIGKVIEGKIYNGKSRLLKMRRIELWYNILKSAKFTLCGSVGDNDSFYAHGYPDNFAIYHIIIKGNVKMARPFESEYVSLDADGNNFVNVKDYLYSKRYYTSSSPYHMFGFNAHEPNQDWMVNWWNNLSMVIIKVGWFVLVVNQLLTVLLWIH